jgi:hypothetical protein
MEHKDFTYDMVPPLFAVCFIKDCPQTAACLRHFAGTCIPAGIHTGPAVYPTALNDGKCPEFKPLRIMCGAWGFDTIFAEVKQKDSTRLRNGIKQFLGGHGTYYRYHNGSRLLTPEQQEWIISLFRSSGYTENLTFDHYEDVYDFS